jgi:hypothetical protein
MGVGASLLDCRIYKFDPHDFIIDPRSYMLLLTDPNKPSYESFCYAMPQGEEAWDVWVAAAARFKSDVMGIAKAYRVDGNDKVDLIVLLPRDDQSDEEAETAAAHLRVNEKFEGKIFVVRRAPKPPERNMRLAALSGGYTDIECIEEGQDMEKRDA